jgi:hypothetical protein
VPVRWRYPYAGEGSCGLDPEIVQVVLRLARENPRSKHAQRPRAQQPRIRREKSDGLHINDSRVDQDFGTRRASRAAAISLSMMQQQKMTAAIQLVDELIYDYADCNIQIDTDLPLRQILADLGATRSVRD